MFWERVFLSDRITAQVAGNGIGIKLSILWSSKLIM